MTPSDPVPAVPAQRRAERPVLHSETRALSDMIDRLASRFPMQTRATVAEIVSQAHQGYDESALRDFIPLLVERDARRQLGHTTPATPAPEASSAPSQAGVG